MHSKGVEMPPTPPEESSLKFDNRPQAKEHVERDVVVEDGEAPPKYRPYKATRNRRPKRFVEEQEETDNDSVSEDISDHPMSPLPRVNRVRDEAPSRQRRPRARREGNYISGIVDWTLGFMGTVMNLLKYPLAIAIVLAIISFGIQSGFGLITFGIFQPRSALPAFVCHIPGPSFLEICQPTPTIPTKPDPLFEKGLNYGSKLEEMQRLGANSVELPYYLSIGEGEVRKLVLALSATSIPSRERLMPLLQEYQRLASTAIDGLQDWLSRIDQVVDKTILINSWAERQLQTIEDRDSSPFAPINNAIGWLFGHPEGVLRNQMEVREAFFGMTGKVEEQVTKVLFQAQKQRGILIELKNTLDEIAFAALGDHEVLKKDQLDKKRYWKWVLRSYRTEMKDFDAKMEMCASFYAHTEQALTVVSTTLIKLQQMKGELVVFRDGLQDASLTLEGGEMISLQLYIDVLKVGVTNLEETRRSTKLIKSQKMREIEEAMHT